MRALPYAWALFVACIPPPHAIEGTPCDGPDPCPAPWVCQANVCASSLDAGATNLLCDPSFEDIASNSRCSSCWCPHRQNDGGTQVLDTVTDSGFVLRSGLQSALVTGNSSQPSDYGLFSLDVTETLAASTWVCSSAWIQSATSDLVSPTGIILVVTYADGGVLLWERDAGSSVELVPGSSWSLISNQLQPGAGTVALSVAILSTQGGINGAPFYVDDAALWLSEDGGCASGP
jgi:hypothetical protein